MADFGEQGKQKLLYRLAEVQDLELMNTIFSQPLKSMPLAMSKGKQCASLAGCLYWHQRIIGFAVNSRGTALIESFQCVRRT